MDDGMEDNSMDGTPTTSNIISVSRKRAAMSDGPPEVNFCEDHWTWNRKDKSKEVILYGDFFKTVHFHPDWSNGTAGVRGTRVLNNGCYYWEIRVSERIFGTSMMFGIGTKKARLHLNAFVNLLGEDEHGWGLSHKGLLWHDGKWRQYSRPFRENEPTTIGLLYDGHRGTLTYFKDGRNLGVAFNDLHKVPEDLYPVVCSTAAKTEMILSSTKRGFMDLQDRCRDAVLRCLRSGEEDVDRLIQLPRSLREYVAEGCESNQLPQNPGAPHRCKMRSGEGPVISYHLLEDNCNCKRIKKGVTGCDERT